LKKSAATTSIAQNGEFQNPKGRVLESKFSTQAYFEKNILRAGHQKRFSTASTHSGSRAPNFAVPHKDRRSQLQ
jgi:hypothetical protein